MSSVRDNRLLDALEALSTESYSGIVWRSVRAGRPPGECSRSGGRWDDKSFDVLYTSETREGAIEERRFHLFKGQPIAPSRIQYELFKIPVVLKNTLRLSSVDLLSTLGLNVAKYGSVSYAGRESEYPSSRQIAEAAFFIGADGIVVPNARHDSLNLIIFCDQDPSPEIGEPMSTGIIKWS